MVKVSVGVATLRRLGSLFVENFVQNPAHRNTFASLSLPSLPWATPATHGLYRRTMVNHRNPSFARSVRPAVGLHRTPRRPLSLDDPTVGTQQGCARVRSANGVREPVGCIGLRALAAAGQGCVGIHVLEVGFHVRVAGIPTSGAPVLGW